MKKLFMAAAIFMVGASSVMAQKGEKAIGVNVSKSSLIMNTGIGVKFQYGISDDVRFEPSYDYYTKYLGLSMWELNLNLHYICNVTDKFKFYPLAGLSYGKSKFSESDFWGDDVDFDYDDYSNNSDSGSESESDSGIDKEILLNLGAGAEYRLSDRFSFNVELKHQMAFDDLSWNHDIFSVGATYKF